LARILGQNFTGISLCRRRRQDFRLLGHLLAATCSVVKLASAAPARRRRCADSLAGVPNDGGNGLETKKGHPDLRRFGRRRHTGDADGRWCRGRHVARRWHEDGGDALLGHEIGPAGTSDSPAVAKPRASRHPHQMPFRTAHCTFLCRQGRRGYIGRPTVAGRCKVNTRARLRPITFRMELLLGVRLAADW
jgi:hypothetical protein